jgi:hypothetical protein
MQRKRDEAIAILRDALEHGLTAVQAPEIATESDFKSLQGDARFEALLAKGKSAAAPGAEPK